MSITIHEVKTKEDTRQFIDFPHDLYQDDENYVPEVYMGQKDLLNPSKNPFFQHSEVCLYLAKSGNSIVGRIAAILNRNYNKHHDGNVGFFGFFDVIDDTHVADTLLDAAKAWLKEKKVNGIIGPTNFSTNDTAGTLVKGFDSPPLIMMTYNKPYYDNLIKDYGFIPKMDLHAYMIYTDKASAKSIRIADALENRLLKSGITIRSANLKNWKQEVEELKKVYNAAWEDNWGFVPFTDAEFAHLANDLKLLADPEWCYVAEDNGKPIGFSITLPNINEVMIKSHKGRLFPFTIFKLLLNKKKTKYVRILALGVKEEYRKKGIEAIFFAKNIKAAQKHGKLGGEASWILNDNEMMKKGAEKLNGELYKTYRLYYKDI